MKTYRGSCHCQAVAFEIDTDLPELTTCDCSICSRKNALMVKVHESYMRILQGRESLTTYQFHTNIAEHYFCKNLRYLPVSPKTGNAGLLWGKRKLLGRFRPFWHTDPRC